MAIAGGTVLRDAERLWKRGRTCSLASDIGFHFSPPGIVTVESWATESRESGIVPVQLTGQDDAVALERIRRTCLSLRDVEENELQDRPLFHVRRRRFALFNGAGSPPRPRWAASGRSLHFLADPLERDALLADGRFAPSPHHGDRGWLALRLDRAVVDWAEVAELLRAAHRQVARER